VAPKVVQVGDRLAHREEPLLEVERAAEENRKHVDGRLGRARVRDRRLELRQARRMVRAKLRDPKRDAAKGNPWDGSTSVSGGSASNACCERRNRSSGSPSGSAGHTATLVVILGRSMSPEISTPASGA